MADASDPMIRLAGVSFTYRDAAEPALRDVSLDIGRGEFVVVMGASGAGKTTLAKCLNRTVPSFQAGAFAGTVCVDGRDATHARVADLAGTVAFVSQDFEAQLFATSAAEEVAFGLEQAGVPTPEMRERVVQALAAVGLAGFERRDPATLSGGEKQRLAIAAVLALRPRILVLDEPTTDLDPRGKVEVFDALAALRSQGLTIVLVEHEIAAAERADRLVLMADGRIVAADAPARILPAAGRLEDLGVRATDLDRIGAALGCAERLASLDAAEAALRAGRRSPAISTASPRRETAALIEMDDVGFEYAPGRTALADVSLRIAAGEFIALIGQNGSGKSTLARHLNGLLHPTRGQVRLRGRDVRALPLNEVAREVGYVFQDPDQQIFADSIREEVGFGLRNAGIDGGELAARTAEALAAVGLSGLEDEDPFLLGKGHREQLAVASVLAMRPAVLVLDEPTTGLDYREQRRMLDLVRGLHQGGLTVVMITHSPWVVAEYAQRGVLMRGGRVVFDGPLRRLFAEEALLEDCHFRIPDVTRLGRRFGVTPLTLGELLGPAADG